MHDRVIVDNMYEFQHSSSRAGCTFSMQDSRVKRESNIGHKTQQARLPADPGLDNSTFPSLVNCILTIPECRSDHHGSCTATAWSRQNVCSLCHPRASLGFKTFFANFPLSVHKILIDCCSCFALALLLLCSCACSCCHDPFIVRSASNLFIVPRFHSVCASVSMFTINTDNCLFPFLGMFLFLSSTRVSVQISRPLSVHRSRPPCVHTSLCMYTPSSCYGVWGPWPVEYQACDMNNIVVQKQRLALLQHLRNSSPA